MRARYDREFFHAGAAPPRHAPADRPRRPPRRGWRLALAGVMLLALLLVNVRAERPGDFGTVMAQLRHLGSALDHGAGESMQRLFPEGCVFTWALYGLAAAQVADQLPSGDPRRADCLERARRAVERVDSDAARRSFDPELELPYGAFYNGWSLYLRAQYLRAVGVAGAPAPIVAGFRIDCARLADAFARSPTPFLASYRDMAWPGDNAVGVAALALHDRLFPPAHGETISRWLEAARARLDPEFGVMSHAADAETGAPLNGVRGSSLALVSRLLVEAAPSFAAEEYAALRRTFVARPLGIPGVREHPPGHDGPVDVDSGPLILGFSGPALVVGAAAARAHGDEALARHLFSVVEVSGLPFEFFGRRAYALGLLPVGDAFIAWARSTPPGPPPGGVAWPRRVPETWRWPWHLGSVLVAALLVVVIARPPR